MEGMNSEKKFMLNPEMFLPLSSLVLFSVFIFDLDLF